MDAKKLELNRETIRPLDDSELDEVVGGTQRNNARVSSVLRPTSTVNRPVSSVRPQPTSTVHRPVSSVRPTATIHRPVSSVRPPVHR